MKPSSVTIAQVQHNPTIASATPRVRGSSSPASTIPAPAGASVSGAASATSKATPISAAMTV